MHHPFTAPNQDDVRADPDDLTNARAIAYDLVYNGVEIGGGSLRIYRRDTQEKVFDAIGLSADEGGEQIRVSHGGVSIRRSAARRSRVRARAIGDDARGGKIDPRRHRVPENGGGTVFTHARARACER